MVPVSELGGLCRDGATPADLGTEVADWVNAGHHRVKSKVGGASEADEIARISACRQAIGPDIELLIDAHYTFAVEAAERFAERAAPYDVGWFEAPIRPDDWARQKVLAASSPLPLFGNKTLPWRDAFMRLADAASPT